MACMNKPVSRLVSMDYITATRKVGLLLHSVPFCLFPRSGDVIHLQLWESGSGYETRVVIFF